jgi:hypothetical protein
MGCTNKSLEMGLQPAGLTVTWRRLRGTALAQQVIDLQFPRSRHGHVSPLGISHEKELAVPRARRAAVPRCSTDNVAACLEQIDHLLRKRGANDMG